MKLILNTLTKMPKTHIFKTKDEEEFKHTLCNNIITPGWSYTHEGDISQVTCKKCIKAWESEK